jgi:methyl-accepting chemotaxis protein
MTFGKKLLMGFGIAFALLIAIAFVAYRGIGSLTQTSSWVAHTHNVLEKTLQLENLLLSAESGERGYVITGDVRFVELTKAAEAEMPRVCQSLRDLTQDNAAQQERLDVVEPLIRGRLAELDRIIETRRTADVEGAQKAIATGSGLRVSEELRTVLGQLQANEQQLLKTRVDDGEAAGSLARATLVYGTALCALLMLVACAVLNASLSGKLGSAVQHIQSSSVELQAAANQQVTGTKEQATAMNEITMTITELLTTSRQIAESAQRVARIASDTASAARGGDHTMQRTQESVFAIRKQVDVIVNHMLELGRKSQQIGGILEIINELSEQTNILSINATIEAAGAGEMGRRFAVVAEEIRKLSDRVGGSTKEIRTLVDDIRAAVNTTVMATEGGSKAVDAGSRQFGEVAESFSRIVGLVSTTTDAAREIELSTKQQATAVEQVNVAVSNVAQATKESESSSAQTLQTASQLASLSRELTKLIRPEANA